jgi:hypothetical protein
MNCLRPEELFGSEAVRGAPSPGEVPCPAKGSLIIDNHIKYFMFLNKKLKLGKKTAFSSQGNAGKNRKEVRA